ncbi:hypothetical protein Poli38472_006512 [Pythium oligandrum]|uniref:SET domain-containing protein n=1 Tax=Pythium oligandrum TaxID=41045 RepID=A0A8K1C5M0_PYTOL|nr:hypothetical protein Poli38472_006512 [Pythium oligandrum]|eukprot:TMW56502.1 hypothetical protein Poli38472_006512 [Pythium oligandrum]
MIRSLHSMRRVTTLSARRHFSASSSTTATSLKTGQTHLNGDSMPARYMPPNAKGRYVIEQLSEHWRSCIAAVDFQPGQVIGTAPGIFHKAPTRFTVQADTDKHLEFAGGLEFVNHSCDPNARLVVSENTPEVAFVATKHIKNGEYVTFDYSTSEWDMDEKFECRCGTPKCRGHIGGAKHLTDAQVKDSMPLFTPSVLRLLLEKKLAQ